jgi:hypothetical protein
MSSPLDAPAPMTTQPYRALVCITTCLRPTRLKSYLPHFARMSADDPRFCLLVALDGDDPATRELCERWDVPLLYSERREGVGMSKNRALERFPDFDYYFFVEDDTELLDAGVFPAHVELSRASGIHHFSLFERGGVRRETGRSVIDGHVVVHGLFGGAPFSFFTGEGLRQVGGWHPRFAEFCRWGHTEHSYRFFRAGLTPAPFNVAESLADACIWHFPPSVSQVPDVQIDQDQVCPAERELIDADLRFVPVQTRAPYIFNDVPFEAITALAATLEGAERYPLVTGADLRHCLSDYHLHSFRTARAWPQRTVAIAQATLNWPGNPALRHLVKTAVRR